MTERKVKRGWKGRRARDSWYSRGAMDASDFRRITTQQLHARPHPTRLHTMFRLGPRLQALRAFRFQPLQQNAPVRTYRQVRFGGQRQRYSRFQTASNLFMRWAATPTFYRDIGVISAGGAGFYVYNLESVPVSTFRSRNTFIPWSLTYRFTYLVGLVRAFNIWCLAMALFGYIFLSISLVHLKKQR